LTLKNLKVIGIFGIFVICFLVHFMYIWFPNVLFSIFFPVNESIFEHMKIIFTSILIYSIIDYILLKKFNITFHNFITNMFLSGFLSTILFLIIYLPLYMIFGESFILNIIILFIVIVFSQIISYFVLKSKEYELLNYVSLIGIIFVYIIFGILTYYPIINDLFYDQASSKYGINTYNI